MVFLDISKAYDTICRQFLYAVMRQHGASEGMIQWVQLLLFNTTAVTTNNVYASVPATWHAGVRQGWPLSPYLDLFVGEALASWLSSSPDLGSTKQPQHRLVRQPEMHYKQHAQLSTA